MKKILFAGLLVFSSATFAQTFTGIVVNVQVLPGQYASECDLVPATFSTSAYLCSNMKIQQPNEYIIVVEMRGQVYKFRTKRHYTKGDRARVVINAILED